MNFLEGVVVKISDDLALHANSLLAAHNFNNKKILLISDEKIWKNCAKFFADDFKKSLGKTLILKLPKPNENNISKIKNASKDFNLLIALGSGVINDLCKIVSAQNNIPYISFPTAPSMNGYLSRNASIITNGHKKTVPATLPKAIFIDLKILKTAPKTLIKAGIGDSLCFYSCWFDWLLSHLILGTKFNSQPFEILQKKIDFLFKNYHKFKIDDEKFLHLLIEILLLSGAGMAMAGGSYPASQGEHLIAHAFEMKYKKKAQKIFHGLQIAVTIFSAIKLQKSLISKTSLQLTKNNFEQKKIAKFFGKKIATECKKEFEQKNNFDLAETNKALKQHWPTHRKKLAKIFCDEKTIKQILQHFKIKSSAQSLGLSSKQYQELVTNAKFIRNRFTCLDI